MALRDDVLAAEEAYELVFGEPAPTYSFKHLGEAGWLKALRKALLEGEPLDPPAVPAGRLT